MAADVDEECVRHAYLAGQREWPELKLAFEDFQAHCERVNCADPQRFAPDLFLACACARGDDAATTELLRHRLPQSSRAIARVQSDADFISETLQLLQQRLLVGPKPKVAEYSGRGPLAAWLAVVATRLALDQVRGRRARMERHWDLPEQLADSALELEVRLAKAEYVPVFQHALRDAVRRLEPRARNVLRMHVAGCSVDQIGRAYSVHRATAARWVAGARSEVFEFIRGQLTHDQGQLSATEFDSVAKLVQSQLDLGFLQGATLSSVARDESLEHSS